MPVARRPATCLGLALALALPLASCVMADAVSCDPDRIGYAESQMGFDYRADYPSPIAEILSRGEEERLANAGGGYAELSPEIRRAERQEWQETIRRLFDGTLPPSFTGGDEPDFDFLRGAAPTMLARLKACGPAADPRLAYLASIPLEGPDGDVE